MASWVSAQDIKDRWIGTFPPEVTDTVLDVLIADAQLLISNEYPLLVDDVAFQLRAKAVIIALVSGYVRAAVRNPGGAKQMAETIGPYSRSATYGSPALADMVLSAGQRLLLAGPAADTGKAFSVDQAAPRVLVDGEPPGWWTPLYEVWP